MHADPHARAQAEALYYAALESIAARQPQAAIEDCRRALALDPTYYDAMHALIHAHQDLGQFDEGIAVARELARLDPEDVLAYTSLSILYQHKGLVPEAEEAALQGKLLGWKQQLRASKSAGEL